MRITELLAELSQQIDRRPQVNISMDPGWLKVRTVILEALWSYPEIRVMLAERLEQLEEGDGHKVDAGNGR